MKSRCGAIGLGLALLACAPAHTWAGTSQTTNVRAPITAVAIGPSKASIEVNTKVVEGQSRSVTVRRPLTAVAVPFRNVSIRVN